MSNPFFQNTIDLLPATKARAGDVEANLTAVEAGFDEAKQYFDRTLRGARANPAISEIPDAATRANKALTFDGSGNPVATVTTTEISNAQTYATNAQNSATAAAGSASAAAGSASTANAAATNANVVAVGTNLQGSNTIGTVATNIANVNTVGTNITNVNTVAGISANVTTVATNISGVNTAAANIAAIVDAPNQASAAAASAAAAAASYDSFDDRYLGAKASNPTLDNDGNALLTGALYWNTAVGEMRAWSGSAWVTTSVANAVSRGGDTMTGNLDFSGTAIRIRGDFSNATVANRLMFQTSAANEATVVQAIPSGTGTASAFSLSNSSDANNGSEATLYALSTVVRIDSTKRGTGSFLPMAFYTGGAERLRIDSSGNVGVGTASPITGANVNLTANGAIAVRGALSANTSNAGVLDYSAGVRLLSYGSASTVGEINFFSGLENATPTKKLGIDTSGNVLVTGGGGLGYGVGSGGTVTQATSKSTAVTLNKPTGKITMNNAALGAGASVVFTVNNTLAQNNDLIVVNTDTTGGFTPDTYRVEARASVNAFAIKVTNTSGGSLSEAVVINFAIIKGATS